MNSTGTKCTKSGKYKCSTHPSYVIFLSKGETFPPCNHNDKGHGTNWILAG